MTTNRFALPIEPQPGSAGLICGDTPIRSPGGARTIADILERRHRGDLTRVAALDRAGSPQPCEIHYVRRVGDDEVVELVTDQGVVLHATPAQLMLDATGHWRTLGSLRPGDLLAVVADQTSATHTSTVVSVSPGGSRAVYEFVAPTLHNVVTTSGLVIHD